MNIPYLVKILETDKFSEVVVNIDLLPIDMNLAIWDSIDAGEIEVDEENDKITILKSADPSSDDDLRSKILRVLQHYAKNNTNATRGRLNGLVKDPLTREGYPWHEYVMAVQHLVDDGHVVENVVDVPAVTKTVTNNKGKKKQIEVRPAHKFVFLGLAENAEVNPEWDAKTVNKWIASFEEQK